MEISIPGGMPFISKRAVISAEVLWHIFLARTIFLNLSQYRLYQKSNKYMYILKSLTAAVM